MPETDLILKKTIGEVLDHLQITISKIKLNQPKIGRKDNTYDISQGHEWTDGYWASQLWLAYTYLDKIEDPRSVTFYKAAIKQLNVLTQRYSEHPEEYDHGVGHIFMPAATLAYEITNDDKIKQIIIDAADSMLKRELLDTGIILAWNVKDNYKQELKYLVSGLTIIDTMDSIPLLYWASKVTNNPKYEKLATRHAKNIAKYLIREDGSTYHAFQFNPKTGEPIRGMTWQGYSDESCWSRGQSWAIHGFAIAYQHTKDEIFLSAAEKTAQFAIDNLPEDFVPNWDYNLPDDAPKYSDSSAAAIMASGLLSLQSLMGSKDTKTYGDLAIKILHSLGTNYFVGKDSPAEGLLLHGTSSFPDGRYDTMLPYGDFFYFESLLRAAKLNTSVW